MLLNLNNNEIFCFYFVWLSIFEIDTTPKNSIHLVGDAISLIVIVATAVPDLDHNAQEMFDIRLTCELPEERDNCPCCTISQMNQSTLLIIVSSIGTIDYTKQRPLKTNNGVFPRRRKSIRIKWWTMT